MTHPPTMELETVRLRPMRREDASALLAYLSRPAVTELTAYPVITLQLVESIIEKSLSRWSAGDLGKWGVALRDSDRLIGTCGFNESSPAHRWAELAYDLSHDYWGKGLMCQAVNAVLDWTFSQGKIERVHAFVRIDNERSARFLLRAGFVREGCLRSYRVCRGQPFDFSLFSLLRAEWMAQS